LSLEGQLAEVTKDIEFTQSKLRKLADDIFANEKQIRVLQDSLSDTYADHAALLSAQTCLKEQIKTAQALLPAGTRLRWRTRTHEEGVLLVGRVQWLYMQGLNTSRGANVVPFRGTHTVMLGNGVGGCTYTNQAEMLKFWEVIK